MTQEVASSTLARSIKLCVVGRRDLPAGLRAAQMAHAVAAFALERREEADEWSRESNNLILLEVDDEACLASLVQRLLEDGEDLICFREPDRGDELTAVATLAWRRLSSLPLAYRGAKST